MLLPSAISCDSSQSQSAPQPALPRLQTALFVSPPASPPTLSSQNAFGNIVSTCRSLQSLITAPPAAEELPSMYQLPTPPLAYAPPPLKLRLRSRANKPELKDGPIITPRKRIAKRAPPRGVNKRRRDDDDDEDNDADLNRHEDEDVNSDLELDEQQDPQQQTTAPSTPKRARIAPEQLPLGLERSDFHEMHLRDVSGADKPSANAELEADNDEWSAEDDRILVELVLDKLNLSKTEWQECARSLGKDRHSVGRRWKSLMSHGDVGIKTRSSRRAKLHATWR